MRNLLIFVAVLLHAIAGFALNANCKINFKLQDVDYRTELTITSLQDRSLLYRKLQLLNGSGATEFELPESMLVLISERKTGRKAIVSIEPGTITVEGSLKVPLKLKVSGSSSQKALQFYSDSIFDFCQTYKKAKNKVLRDSARNGITKSTTRFLEHTEPGGSSYYLLYKVGKIYENHIDTYEEMYSILQSKDTTNCFWKNKVENYIDGLKRKRNTVKHH